MEVKDEFKCPACGETIQLIRKRRPHIRRTKESSRVTKFTAVHTNMEYRVKPMDCNKNDTKIPTPDRRIDKL